MTKLPFDLEKALSGKYKIVTRDGQEVDYIHDTGLDIDYRIVGHIKGEYFSKMFTKDGRWDIDDEKDCDLLLVEEKKKGWVVICRDEDYGFLSVRCNSIVETNDIEAFYKSKGTYLQTVEVEY